ncbi:MAG TPA: hypothetical protein PK349_13150 [Candidatus Hydrogenedentes bacterium]|nr:hypothetical protein [Candidatus Hydrogenedentota bacterium]
MKTKCLHVLKYALISSCLLAGMIVLLLLAAALYEEPMTMHFERALGVTVSNVRPVVPGPGMPEGFTPLRSTNNVDLIRVDDLFFMAFRTAPSHFASPNARLHVMRSDDLGETWHEEYVVRLERDVREPRFLYFNNKLFLYFYTGGVDPLRFEPGHIHVCWRQPSGTWTRPEPIYKPGYVVWRARARNDVAWMSVYYGADIYGKGSRGEARLLCSRDGLQWEPISEKPQVDWVGAEEAEFVFDEHGGIVALVRLEVGGGALVCRAPADRLDQWETRFTPYKVDSSLMFTCKGRYFVVGRRNVAGRSARALDWPESIRNAWSMAFYSITRKRTCVYEIDPETLELFPLFDLPSRGDTAFAGMAPLDDEGRYLLVNYSSPLDGPDWPWIGGQLFGSVLYGCELDCSRL